MLPSLRLLIFAFLVCLIGLLAYSPGLNGPLLHDDKAALVANTLLQIDGTNADEWRTAATSFGSGPLGRQISMTSFAANQVLAGGFSPRGFKAVNLIIHFCIALLLSYFSLSKIVRPFL